MPAEGAKVSIYIVDPPDNTIPQSMVMPLSTYTTDNQGRFEIVDLPEGIYNLLAEKGSFILFQDSLLVTSTYTTLRDDTLECPSTLSGIVTIEPNHDPQSVTILLPGTGRWPVAADSLGRFTLTGLASGSWPLMKTG